MNHEKTRQFRVYGYGAASLVHANDTLCLRNMWEVLLGLVSSSLHRAGSCNSHTSSLLDFPSSFIDQIMLSYGTRPNIHYLYRLWNRRKYHVHQNDSMTWPILLDERVDRSAWRCERMARVAQISAGMDQRTFQNKIAENCSGCIQSISQYI